MKHEKIEEDTLINFEKITSIGNNLIVLKRLCRDCTLEYTYNVCMYNNKTIRISQNQFVSFHA